ncbi:MAG: hypothetical protein ACR2NJ_05045 [Acidimicrobiales bacterium]
MDPPAPVPGFGYEHIHVIGLLFLFTFVGGVILAMAMLSAPARFLWLVAASAALMAAGTLSGLAFSIHFGLFGFKDSLHAPFAKMSIGVEAGAAVVLTATAARSALSVLATPGRPVLRRRELDRPATES